MALNINDMEARLKELRSNSPPEYVTDGNKLLPSDEDYVAYNKEVDKVELVNDSSFNPNSYYRYKVLWLSWEEIEDNDGRVIQSLLSKLSDYTYHSIITNSIYECDGNFKDEFVAKIKGRAFRFKLWCDKDIFLKGFGQNEIAESIKGLIRKAERLESII